MAVSTALRSRANLAGEGIGMLEDVGCHAINILYVPANVADTQTVTIGANVYEFDRSANGVTAGRIAVTGHANDTPAAATNALITAINTKGTEKVVAVDIGDTEILLRHKHPGVFAIACTETLAGAGNVWAAATMFGGASAKGRKMALVSRVPTATEVTLDHMQFYFPFTPTHVQVTVRVTASGIPVAWVGGHTISNGLVTVTNEGGVDWAATDTVSVLAVE